MAFDHKTAADLICGRQTSGEDVKRFATHARWTHDDRESLSRMIADLRAELAKRDAEIAMLKSMLLEMEGE